MVEAGGLELEHELRVSRQRRPVLRHLVRVRLRLRLRLRLRVSPWSRRLTLALTLSLTFIGPRAGTEAPPPCSFSPRKAAAKRLSAASVGALVCGKASWRPSLVFGFGFRLGLVVRAVLGVEA